MHAGCAGVAGAHGAHSAAGWGAQAAAARGRGARRRAAAGRAGERQGRGRRAAGARWARGLCAQAGPAGPGWSFIHSDSVFGPGSTRYFFSESLNEYCSL